MVQLNGTEKQIAFAEELKAKRIIDLKQIDKDIIIPFTDGIKITPGELIEELNNTTEASLIISSCKNFKTASPRILMRIAKRKGDIK